MLPRMNSRNFRFAALFAAAAILASACSSSEAAEAPTTTTTAAPETAATTTPPETTTVPEATTSTEPGLEISESINGLPAEDKVVDRRVVAVKIDNSIPQEYWNESSPLKVTIAEGENKETLKIPKE